MSLYKIKTCLKCGESFTGHIARKRCPECQEESVTKKVLELICAYDKCKKPFSTTRTDQRFCKKRCRKQHHSSVYYARKEQYND